MKPINTWPSNFLTTFWSIAPGSPYPSSSSQVDAALALCPRYDQLLIRAHFQYGVPLAELSWHEGYSPSWGRETVRAALKRMAKDSRVLDILRPARKSGRKKTVEQIIEEKKAAAPAKKRERKAAEQSVPGADVTAVDTSAPTVEQTGPAVVALKKRGRPKKTAPAVEQNAPAAVAVLKKRGRPKKAEQTMPADEPAPTVTDDTPTVVVAKKRGRPRKLH